MKKEKEYITDKKLADRRFAKSEMAIIEAMTNDPEVSVSRLVKNIKISRPTFYRHHKTILSITNDYEKYLRKKFTRRLNSLSRQEQPSFNRLCQEALFFILHHKRIFRILARRNGEQVFRIVIEPLKPWLEEFAKLPKNSERIFRIYVGEVEEIFLQWYENDFCDDEMKTMFNDIMYLSKTARTRLMPLVHER